MVSFPKQNQLHTSYALFRRGTTYGKQHHLHYIVTIPKANTVLGTEFVHRDKLLWTIVTDMAKKVLARLVVFWYLTVSLGSAALCQEGFSYYSPQECSHNDKVDLLYQKLEKALINNSKALLQMKQIFFPVARTHIQEVQILRLHVCVRVIDQFKSSGSTINISNENDSSIPCWNFKWSASVVLSLISIDQLMALDFAYVDIIYSSIQGTMAHKIVSITLRADLLPSMPSDSELQEALVQLLSWGSQHVKHVLFYPRKFYCIF